MKLRRKSLFVVTAMFLCSCAANTVLANPNVDRLFRPDTVYDSDPIGVDGSSYLDTNGKLTDSGWKEMIKDSYEFCEDTVEQGVVLLKNNEVNGAPALPLSNEERNISLLGQGSKNLFMRSGVGTAAPNEAHVVTLDRAFEDYGFDINHTVFDAYSKLSSSNMTYPNTNVEHSFSGFYTNVMKNSFAENGDAAIITFVRIGTENTDPGAGQLDLKNDEKLLLQMVKEYKDNGVFNKIIVLINSPMPMSMDWVDDDQYGIDAAMYVGTPGYYGARGIVHALMGHDGEGNAINPSGHAPNTFAASASSSAAYQNFGNSSVVTYKEGIYVGYKYYETRYEDCVLNQGNANQSAGVYKSSNNEWNYADEMGYPFGYGLSYTTFNQRITSVTYDSETDSYDVTVSVSNTGTKAGKASVQLYAQQPYTNFDKEYGIGKSAIAFMAYDKVDLNPGQTKTVNLKVDRYLLATYDYKVNRKYILEGGTYYFAVGNGAHEALNNILSVKSPTLTLYDHLGNVYQGRSSAVKSVQITEDLTTYSHSRADSTIQVTNQFDDADYNWMAENNNKTKITYLDRQNWQGTWPTSETTSPATTDDLNMAQYYTKASDCPSYTDGDGVDYNVMQDTPITFEEMKDIPIKGAVATGRFANQDGSEVWDMFIKQMSLDDLAISISDGYGISAVKTIKKPATITRIYGAEGICARFNYGDKRWATGFPAGPTYTATFDPAVHKKVGQFYGEESIFTGIPVISGIQAGINRTPYGSRPTERLSEDGIFNYQVSANVVSEARKKGLIMTVGMCALNNQETYRQRLQTYANEQAIREIYLKPFEGVITEGHALGLQTSYNRIGARYAAVHEPLMMNVIRGEWNYRGMIADEALTGSNNDSYSNGPAMLHCGTDLFSLDSVRGGQLKTYITANNNGQILKDMQRANKYILYTITRSWVGRMSGK